MNRPPRRAVATYRRAGLARADAARTDDFNIGVTRASRKRSGLGRAHGQALKSKQIMRRAQNRAELGDKSQMKVVTKKEERGRRLHPEGYEGKRGNRPRRGHNRIQKSRIGAVPITIEDSAKFVSKAVLRQKVASC